MNNSYLNEIASKLNLDENKVLRKANELFKLTATQKSLSFSESCKAVICLELASMLTGAAVVSRKDAIKYSGCKKSAYINMYNIISKVLNVDKNYSIKELCLTVGVSEIEGFVANLFEKYQETKCLPKSELEHPMYRCAAIMAACRIHKIKMNSIKLVELSRIKKSELEELSQTLEQLNEETKRSKQMKRKSVVDVAVLSENCTSKSSPKAAKKKTEEELEEEYQEWKQRMLAE